MYEGVHGYGTLGGVSGLWQNYSLQYVWKREHLYRVLLLLL